MAAPPPPSAAARTPPRRGAHSTFSAQVGHATTHMWRPEAGVGHVPYVVVAGCWLAAGPPLAPANVQPALTRAFVAAARRAGAKALFFGMPAALAEAAELRWLRCGEEPLWQAGAWAQAPERAGARRQVRRAQRLGAEVAPLVCPPGQLPPAPLADQLTQLLARWQAGQSLPPLGFLAKASLRHDAADALRFVAYVRGEPVALAVVLPSPAGAPWLVEQLIRAPSAPNGTIELLVDRIMHALALRDPEAWVSLGVVALAGPVAWPLRLARWLGRDLYPFAGLWAFRRKLAPERTVPLGLAYPPDCSAPRAVATLLLAFTDGRPWRFAWASMRQGSTPLLWTIATCLVPWTVALARAPTAWFAGPAGQWAWVAFDTLLAGALLRLAYRPSLQLARTLAVAVSADVALTVLEAALVPGPPGPWAWRLAVRGVAVAGPALAACVLWGLTARLRRRSAAGQGFVPRTTSGG